jgi:hypothetical protein
VGEPCGGELLGVAARLHEGAFQGGDLLVEQIIGLVDQANDGVGADGRLGVLQPRGVEGPALLIGQIGPIRLMTEEATGHLPHGAGLRRARSPLREAAVAKKVLEVQQEFLEAGAGHVEQAQLGLGRSGGGAAGFGDVLPAAARSLNHLVHGAGARVEEFFAEPVGGVVDERGGLKTGGLPVTAAGAEAFF